MRKSVWIWILSFSLCLPFCQQAQDQYGPTLSQYMFNGLILNPAYAGSGKVSAMNLSYRNQWTGFSGAPVTQILSGHTPLKGSPIAIGGMLTNEEIGVNSDLRVMGMASYRLEQQDGSFQFGLGAGMGISQSRWSEVITDEQDDLLFQGSDRSLIRPIFSTGVFYETKTWYAGYSVPSLLSHEYVNDEQLRTHFSPGDIEHNLTGGWAKSIGRGVVLKPSFLLRSIPNASVQMDINANLIFQDRLWTGLSLRMDRSVVAMLEYQINHQFRIGYAYDYGLSKLYSYTIGSHEIMLIWQKKRRALARSPRYF